MWIRAHGLVNRGVKMSSIKFDIKGGPGPLPGPGRPGQGPKAQKSHEGPKFLFKLKYRVFKKKIKKLKFNSKRRGSNES